LQTVWAVRTGSCGDFKRPELWSPPSYRVLSLFAGERGTATGTERFGQSGSKTHDLSRRGGAALEMTRDLPVYFLLDAVLLELFV